MARLFGRKTTEQSKGRGVSAALNPEQASISSEPTSRAELERIIKTTDAMNIALSSDLLKTKETLAPREQSELNSIREAITRSYDLARRKITTQYEQVILSNNYVDNPFLAVQVTIKNIDRNWEVQNVERIIRKFTDAIVEQIALGKTVYLNDELIIEPLSYVDKILPTWKITPKFAVLTNAIKWEQIVDELGQDGSVSLADAKYIAGETVDAITTNVKNGYFVKISRLIIMQIQVGAPQRVVLFSNDTLERINEIHERFIKTGEQKEIRKYDALVHFDKTLENVERGFYSEDIKTPTLRPDFVPRDLTQEIKVDRSATRKVAAKSTKRDAKATATKPIKVTTSAPMAMTEPTKTNAARKRRVGKKASRPLPQVAAQPTAPKVVSVTLPTPTPVAPKASDQTRTATRKLPANPSATMKVQASKPAPKIVASTSPVSIINPDLPAKEVVTTTTTTKRVITTVPVVTKKSRIIKPKAKVGSFTYTNLAADAQKQTPSASSVKPVSPSKKRK